jgi:phosphatidylglycerol lysyltransferase
MESEQAGNPVTQDRIAHVRELVLNYGWNSTSYQIINPGIDHWFSAKGDAVVGYVKCHNAYVVAGAPVCAKDRLPEVAAEFENVAGRERARVCYFGAEARLESLYDDTKDHSMLLLGVQPAWQPTNWAAMLSRNSSLRAQINRARNKGVVVSEWPTERAHDNPELRRCLEEWLSTRGLPPLHFLVEPETLKRLADRRIFVAERDKEVVGFLIASPVPCRAGWLIEQNIRGRNAPNGCAELLIDAAVRAMAESSSRYVTLGLSPLSKRTDLHSHRNPLWLNFLLGWIRAHGQRFYNFEGLDAFKAKFRPERWEPVFAIANESHFSPLTLYAVASAFSQGSPVLTMARGMIKALKTEIGWLAERVEGNGGAAHKN